MNEQIPCVEVLTTYKCAKCLKSYKTKEEAFKCWKSHLYPVAIAGIAEPEYTPNVDGSGKNYPRYILVNFDDGSVAEYGLTMLKG